MRDEVERAVHACPVRAIRAEVDSPLVDPTSTERDAAGLADQSFASPSRIVVAGASLAGLSAAETLRDLGYHGDLVLIGDEPHPPYDRPPLSNRCSRAACRPTLACRSHAILTSIGDWVQRPGVSTSSPDVSSSRTAARSTMIGF